MADFFVNNKSNSKFQDLMQHRVHEILLVASSYDAFILEEDGHLTEQILSEYIGMNFNYAPRVTRVSTGLDALEIMKNKNIDLVIVMLRIQDQDPISLGTKIKVKYPKKPVVLLAFDETELKQLKNNITPQSINRVFIWSGDSIVFPAIIKYIEDRKNAEQDIIKGDVRAILIIEDSPRMYSTLLPMIYREIMYQTKNLLNRNLPQSQKLLHLRSRPKILLTPNYETGIKFFKKYHKNIIGVISDVRFPIKGTIDVKAGIKFAQWIRSIEPSMPIMLQSNDLKNRAYIKKVETEFLHKGSATLLKDLRKFITENFGFGDFIFKLPNNTEIFRAKNLEQLIEGIEKISTKSLFYHANSHHFSNWLAARTEFQVASQLRLVNAKEFKSGESLRNFILECLKSLQNNNDNNVLDYTSARFNKSTSDFYRLCGGSLGGKARGLAFAKRMINVSGLNNKYPNIDFKIPKCAVIGTDEFDRFMKDNKLWDKALNQSNDIKLEKLFTKARLSIDLMLKLETFIQDNKMPLSVRSSSLLEDSQYQPLAGTYETYMLPNNETKNKQRLQSLVLAIKKVYASTFKVDAKSLLDTTAHRIEEEKMAIVIQEIVGQQYSSERYYPSFSGVLKSINYYPVSYMKRDEGVAYLALGFGKTIVDGEKCLIISPKYPDLKPQFYSVKSIMDNSQVNFYGLNINKPNNTDNDLSKFSLEHAENDGSLKWIGSVISQDDNTIKDSLSKTGSRFISFSPLLKWGNIPLAKIILEILAIGEQSLGCPIEIEFAVNLKDNDNHEFCLLQIKPMVSTGFNKIKNNKNNLSKIFCKSHITLGDGSIDNIKDLLVVRDDTFTLSKTTEIASEIETFNNEFSLDRQYALCGPGRWGTIDPWLGIPVNWSQISQAKVIIEVGKNDIPVDQSFGSHFFQNITSLHIAYFTIDPKRKQDQLDLSWLNDKSIIKKGKFVDWYKFDKSLKIILDGSSGFGNIAQPEYEGIEKMNEEEASGI